MASTATVATSAAAAAEVVPDLQRRDGWRNAWPDWSWEYTIGLLPQLAKCAKFMGRPANHIQQLIGAYVGPIALPEDVAVVSKLSDTVRMQMAANAVVVKPRTLTLLLSAGVIDGSINLTFEFYALFAQCRLNIFESLMNGEYWYSSVICATETDQSELTTVVLPSYFEINPLSVIQDRLKALERPDPKDDRSVSAELKIVCRDAQDNYFILATMHAQALQRTSNNSEEEEVTEDQELALAAEAAVNDFGHLKYISEPRTKPHDDEQPDDDENDVAEAFPPANALAYASSITAETHGASSPIYN